MNGLGGEWSGRLELIHPISSILTNSYLRMAERIHLAQDFEMGPEVDCVKAASDLDDAYRVVSEVQESLVADPGQGAAVACRPKVRWLLNHLRGVSRGAHIMCGTQRDLADTVDASVILKSEVDRRLGVADLPVPEIDLDRAGEILMEVYRTGSQCGFW